MYNSEGAVYMKTGTIIARTHSKVEFAYNLVHNYDGGAICLFNGTIEIDSNASLRFSHNSADINGGAV